MQGHETARFIEIPIDKGTVPNFETRLGYPKLFNMFVGEQRKLYSTAWLNQFNKNRAILNSRAVLETTFGNGSYLVVNEEGLFNIDFTGHVRFIGIIKNNGKPVQMDENLQNQVGIVDGENLYVYDLNSGFFGPMGEPNGFVFKSPISIVVLNSIAIVLDLDTSSWGISDPNNMLLFPPLDNVAQISSALTQAASLQTLDDNLYIFGTTGVERWVPNSGNNPYLFPFAKDNNYRVDFGLLSVNGSQRGFNIIYILSSKYIPMSITVQGAKDLTGEGFAKIIANYPDVKLAQTSFYTYLGNYFFHIYFPESKISWIYNTTTETWANGDDNIVCAVPRQDIVCTDKGIFELTDDEKYAVSKKREWQSDRIKNYRGTEPYRELLNSVEAQIVQGFIQSSTVEPQHINLKISFDSQSWSNTVTALMGNTGDRNDLTIWRCNIAAKEFTFNMQYQGPYNLVVDKVTAILK